MEPEGNGYGMDDEDSGNSSEGPDCVGPTEAQYQMMDGIRMIVGGWGTLVVAVVGVIANILAIAVFCRRSFKSNFNDLLITLAAFDLLFLVMMTTESIRTFEATFGDPTSIGGLLTSLHHQVFPQIIFPLKNILLTCSVYMTVSISIERYLAIFFPVVYKARSQGSGMRGSSLWWHILPVIGLAVVINLPTFFSSKVVVWSGEMLDLEEKEGFLEPEERPADNSTKISVTELGRHPTFRLYYQAWARFLLLGLLPMLLLIVLNLRVFAAIQKRKATCRDASYANILLAIVLVFLICQSPRLFLNFYEVGWVDLCGPPIWFHALHDISNWLITLNSALNFFIYCLTGAKFRQGLRAMLGCGEPPPQGPLSTSNTAVELKSCSTRL